MAVQTIDDGRYVVHDSSDSSGYVTIEERAPGIPAHIVRSISIPKELLVKMLGLDPAPSSPLPN